MPATKPRALLALVLALVVGVLMVAAPAGVSHAEGTKPESWNADQWKRWQALSYEKKNEYRDEALKEIATEKCRDFAYTATLGKSESACVEFTTAALMRLYLDPDVLIQGKDPGTNWCLALASQGASKAAIYQCTYGSMFNIAKVVVTAAAGIVGKLTGASNVIEVAKFIADPKTALDHMANDFKTQAVDGTKEVLNQLTSVTGLDVNSSAYRTLWAAFSGIGVVVMVAMMLMLFKRYGEGKVSDDSFGTAMMYYLPGGFLLALFGPGLMGLGQKWSAGLTDGTSGWAAGKINDFIAVITGFGAMQSTGWFGSIVAILLFGILLLGALGLLIFLLLTPYFLGLAGLTVAILWGLALVPSMRPRLAKVGSVVVLMLFMKPLIFLLLGAVFGLMAATPAFKDGTDDLLVNVGSLAATGILMLMLVFSPAVLFKLMPVVDADDVPSGSGGAVLAGGVAGAVTGGAGRAFSNLQNNTRARRRAAADARGGSGTQAGTGQSSTGLGQGGQGSNRHLAGTQSSPARAGTSSGTSAAPSGGRSRRQRREDQGWTQGGGSVHDGRPGSGSQGAATGSSTTGAGSGASGSGQGQPARARSGAGSALGGAAGSLARGGGEVIKSGLVGALWAGRESARAARRAAADYGQMPSTWGNFKGTAASKEQE